MKRKQNKEYVKPVSAVFCAAPELLAGSYGNIGFGGGVRQGGAHSKANDMWDDELDDETEEMGTVASFRVAIERALTAD